MKIQLYHHQQKCLDAIKNAHNKSKKCIAVMFCGSGKTRVMFHEMVVNDYNLSVVVFPSLALMAQFNADYLMNDEWTMLTKKYKHLSICSQNDDMNKLGVRYTTDEMKIKNFLQMKTPKIVSVTYQSYDLFVNIVKDNNIKIDLLQYDEAHHSVGDKIQNIVYSDNDYDALVEQIVFFTATPKNDNGIIMCDRDNPEKSDCGELVFEYTHREGVEDGRLNDFEIIIDFFKDYDVNNDNYSGLLDAISRSTIETGNSRVMSFHYRSEVDHESRSSVSSFATDYNHQMLMNSFKKVLNSEFPKKKQFFKDAKIKLEGVTASTKNRRNILDRFDSSPDNDLFVLASCRTIGEGVDTKNGNMVVFVDPKQSYSDIIQNIGRICRKPRKNMNKASVLIPCYVNMTKYLEAKTAEEKDQLIREDLNENGNYNGILNVLCALRQSDPELYDACLMYPDVFTKWEIEDSLKKQGYELEMCDDLVDALIKNDVDEDVIEQLEIDEDETENFTDVFSNVSDMCERPVEVHCVDIKEPIKYYGEEYDDEPIRIYVDKDGEFGYIHEKDNNATENNEEGNNKKKLDAPVKKKIKLNVHKNNDMKVFWDLAKDIDFEKNVQNAYITANVVVDNWMETYEKVKSWYDENDEHPSQKSNNHDEKYLCTWTGHQRKNKKKGKLSDDRIKLLEDIDKWQWDTLEENWMETYEKVKQWYEVNDEHPSNGAKDEKEKRLGTWIGHQRNNKKKGKLSDDKIELLEKIGNWQWDILEENWINIYDDIKKWYFDNAKHPSHHSKDKEEARFGRWKRIQQTNKKIGKMSDEKIKLLENINGWQWDQYDENWIDAYNNIKKCYSENGKYPSDHSNDKKEAQFGRWIQNQRLKKKKEKLSQEKINLLTLLPLWQWENTFEEQWINIYNDVKKWYAENIKHPSKESISNDEKRLGRWIGNQRINKKNNILSYDRIKLLEQITNWKWDENEEQWVNTYNDLKKWYTENNKNPSNGAKNKEEKRLGCWISTQRINKKKGILSDERIQLLEKIDGWQWENDLEEQWIDTYNDVKKWYDENNKKPSSKSKNKEENKLGRWIGHQRINKKKGILSDNKIKLLGQINSWQWDPLEKGWIDTYNDLKKWYSNKNKKPSINSINKEEKHLGIWIHHQRKNKKKGKLPQERIDLLNLLPWWQWEADKSVPIKDKLKAITAESEKTKTKINETEKKYKKLMSMDYVPRPPKKEHEYDPNYIPRQQNKSQLSELHKKYKTMHSANLNNHFKENKDAWAEYHRIKNENEKAYPDGEIPYQQIIKLLENFKTVHTKHVVDMGCGEAKVSEHFKNNNKFKFYNYDHVACNDDVKECDIRQLPHDDNSINICILSLAMWGSNCHEYIDEAYRVLEDGGMLFVIESSKRWMDDDQNNKLVQLLEGKKFHIKQVELRKFMTVCCVK